MAKRKKKPKLPSRRKLLSQWSKQILAKWGNKCCVCGSEHKAIDSEGKRTILNAHHLMQKEVYPELKYDLMNGVTLCSGKCHKFGHFSVHKNPVWFYHWLQQTHPDLWQWAVDRIDSRPE